MTTTSTHGQSGVQRQIKLPMSKAVEIAYKSIRLRLSRSLVVTSGIVLALAFLMSILTTDAFIDSMRNWARTAQSGTSPQQQALQQQRDQLEASLGTTGRELRRAAQTAKPPASAVKFDAERHFGQPLGDIQKELGMSLPTGPDDLVRLFTATPASLGQFEQWLAQARQLRQVREELTAPQRLESIMQQKGVPTTPKDIESSRIQTRWLLGLALLVAFVGILNAMLMSVTERFREIGTMKCLGALDSFIVKLFLIESLFQGVAGTVLGVLIGLALSVLQVFSNYGEFAWKQIPVVEVLIGAGVCLVVGIGLTVAGAVYPAWQAARMEPVAAMRVET